MTLHFGTDGVRGVANEDLTPEYVVALGRVAGTVLADDYTGAGKPECILGRDTRVSGAMLSGALAAGLAGAGVDVSDAGVIPTAGVALLAREMGAALGAVVSASHNPAPDNGIKFFGPSGRKLMDAQEKLIETLLLEDVEADTLDMPASVASPTHERVGRVRMQPELVEDFGRILLGTLETPLDGLHVVVDVANGAAYAVGPEVLRRAGARVSVTHDAPDGTNINAGCGATAPASLAEAVRQAGADLGVAFDGDADRLVPVDEYGRVLDGDYVLAMCATDMEARGLLRGKKIVATVMSNVGLRVLLEGHGIGVVECPVGDRNVLNALDEHGLALGGEQSGHVIFRDLAPTGCGILSALQLCQLIVRAGRPLSELADSMQQFPQKLVNVALADKSALDSSEAFWRAVSSAEESVGERGRVIVRPSGTEAKLRIMVQAETQEEVDFHIAGLVAAAEALG